MPTSNENIVAHFMQRHFSKRIRRALDKRFSKVHSRSDKTHQTVLYPYIYGLYVIYSDHNNKVHKYHLQKVTRTMFEVMKMLYDVKDRIKSGEIAYFDKKIHESITDRYTDFAPTHTELYLFWNFSVNGSITNIGEGGGLVNRPDVTVKTSQDIFNCECKTRLLKREDLYKISGLSDLIQYVISGSYPNIAQSVTSFVRVTDSSKLQDKSAVNIMSQQIAEFSNVAPKQYFGEASDLPKSEYLELIHQSVDNFGVDEILNQLRSISKMDYEFQLINFQVFPRPGTVWTVVLILKSIIPTDKSDVVKSFEQAMDQFDSNGIMSNRIVALSLDYNYHSDDSALEFLSKDIITDRMRHVAEKVGSGYVEAIRISNRWADCYGVLLIFTFPSYLVQGPGRIEVEWPRMIRWMPQSTNNTANALPPTRLRINQWLL